MSKPGLPKLQHSLYQEEQSLSESIVKPSTLFIAASLTGVFVLQGCTVLAVADAVGSVAVGTVGLAASAAIGTVKLGGKAVGAVADAVLPGSDAKN